MANERGRAQTSVVERLHWGCKAQEGGSDIRDGVTKFHLSRRSLEGATKEGDSPVGEKIETSACVLEYHGTREILWEAGGTTLQG